MKGQFERRLRCNHHYFDSVDTPDKAYWLGWLLTDGNITDYDVTLRLGIADIDHLQKYKDALESEHKISVRADNSAASVTITSRELTSALAVYGVVARKSSEVTAPDLPRSLQRHFWRGAVEGDGWITVKERDVGICGTHSLVTSFVEFVRTLVPDFTNSVRPAGSIWRVTMKGEAARLVLHELYDDATTWLDRKREAAQYILEYTPKHKGGPKKVYKGFVSPDGTVYAPVTDIQTLCEEHGLCLSKMVAVANGRRPHHQGWTLVAD